VKEVKLQKVGFRVRASIIFVMTGSRSPSRSRADSFIGRQERGPCKSLCFSLLEYRKPQKDVALLKTRSAIVDF